MSRDNTTRKPPMPAPDLQPLAPQLLDDAGMIRLITDLARQRAAVTIGTVPCGDFFARAAFPWAGHGSYLLADGPTLAEAMTNLRIEDQLRRGEE